MTTGGKVANKRQKVQLKKKGRDESDEDYMVEVDDEFDESDDELWSCLVDDRREESLGEYEEEERKEKVKRIGRPRGERSSQRRNGTDVSYREEGEDSDFNDSEEDEEFRPDKIDDDEELPSMKKSKESRSTKRKIEKRKLENMNKTSRGKMPRRESLRRKYSYHVKVSGYEASVARETKRGRKNYGRIGKLDGSSDTDYEYSVSAEEREQMREAREICKSSTTDSRRSSLLNMTEEDAIVPSKQKRSGTKEKERMVGIKVEEGKQVCGICLSEEGKRTVRGVMNSCSHYFCFACIMEWSKVESRCPLCKQMFTTITRTAMMVGEHSSMGVTILVRQRDQVYQPSVEELRRYLDPYEDVRCTECNEGEDDALMLLCDLCDSSAHTYCVGLGCDVPEGNWYCVDCRPTILASSNEPQTSYHEPTLPSPSPRHYLGASPTESVALTVSERRRIPALDIIPPPSRTGLFGSYGHEVHHQHSTSAPDSLRVPSPPRFSVTTMRTGHSVDLSRNTSSYREKEHVQSMVRSQLRSLSRYMDLGYVTFKKIARTSTHTILSAFGLEHRRSEVYLIQTQPLLCNHYRQPYQVAGQCSSCLNWFIKNIVREIMFIYLKD